MKKHKKGFTLVELLVVIAIIGIMSAIIMANFAAARSRSRDTKRISDLSQIQLALAGYFDRCGQYPPASLSTSASTGCPSSISLGTFISSIPTPPNSGETYIYQVDSSNNNNDYFLHATLENNNSASNNSLTSTPGYASPGVLCSGSTDYCVGPK